MTNAQLMTDFNYVFPSDEMHLVPQDWRDRAPMTDNVALIPNIGDCVLVAPRSAWLVVMRHFQWDSPTALTIRLHLIHAPEQLALHRQQPPVLVQPPAPFDSE